MSHDRVRINLVICNLTTAYSHTLYNRPTDTPGMAYKRSKMHESTHRVEPMKRERMNAKETEWDEVKEQQKQQKKKKIMTRNIIS